MRKQFEQSLPAETKPESVVFDREIRHAFSSLALIGRVKDIRHDRKRGRVADVVIATADFMAGTGCPKELRPRGDVGRRLAFDGSEEDKVSGGARE